MRLRNVSGGDKDGVGSVIRNVTRPDLPVIIETDTSDYALAAILSIQEANGDIHPIAFHSRTFSTMELNYDVHDKELLAIFDTFKIWQHYKLHYIISVIILSHVVSSPLNFLYELRDLLFCSSCTYFQHDYLDSYISNASPSRFYISASDKAKLFQVGLSADAQVLANNFEDGDAEYGRDNDDEDMY